MVVLARYLLVELMAFLYYLEKTSAVTHECSDVCDFYEWGKDARCQGRNLISVPQACLHAKTLQMQDNRLARLPEGTFRNFTCLKYLYLERNNLTVEMGAFQGCSKLEKIHLNQNHLPTLTQGLLDGMPNVLYMFMDNASIQEIQPGAFMNLPQLRFLSLENNRLDTPPCDAFGLDSALETLYLTGNNISNLPNDCFKGFDRLTKLYLKKNPLINPNPLAFKGLDSLTLLDLQFTNLTEVPTGIFQNAINIKKLYLSFNNISRLSNRDFMSLYRLTHLYLQHNNIMVIQEQSFEFLGALHTLDLSFNKISTVRENTLSQLSNLREMRFHSNLLNSTRNISFSTIPNDTKVHLADNPLHCDCSLEPFLEWSKASLIHVFEDSRSSSLHARCSSPPKFERRLILSLEHNDLCPLKPTVEYETLTMSAPNIEIQDNYSDHNTAALSSIETVIVITAVVIISVVVVVLFVIIRKKRQQNAKRISTSLDDVNVDPYYISIDGDVERQSSVNSEIHGFLHHPRPPRNSYNSNQSTSTQSTNISDSIQDDIVYSSVLPDGQLPSPTINNGITYISVRPDETDPEIEVRPLSTVSEVPIEEWVRDNFQSDANTKSSGKTDNSESKPPDKNTGSPYITMITQK